MAPMTPEEKRRLFDEPDADATRKKFEDEMSKLSANTSEGAETDDDADEGEITVQVPGQASTAAADKEKATPSKTDAASISSTGSEQTTGSQSPDGQKKEDTTPTETNIDPVVARLELMERELKLRDLQDKERDLEIETLRRTNRQRASQLGNLMKGRKAQDKSDPNEDIDLLADPDTGSGAEETGVDNDLRQMVLGHNARIVNSTIADTINAFRSRTPEADKDQATVDEIGKYVQEHMAEYRPELASGNPDRVAEAVSSLCERGWIAVSKARYVNELNSLRKKREKQSSELQEKKRGAFVSGGSSSTADQASRPGARKSVKDLTDDELRNLINASA